MYCGYPISKFFFIAACIGILGFTACVKEPEIPTDNPLLKRKMAGGEGTVMVSGPDAFSYPLANLGQAGIDAHFDADGLFSQHFVTAPASQFGGVGPVFNQNSCETCHVRNGRGTVPQFPGDPNTGLLIRLSMPGIGQHGGIARVDGFGGQLQTKAVFGSQPEGTISKTQVESIITYLNGQTRTLTQPEYHIENTYIPLPAGVLTSPRIAPPIHGLGLLEAIDEEAILAFADPNDLDGDGISGKPNWVWNVVANTHTLGRFGWKAGQPTAEQQAADAAHNDMGLTSFYFPVESSVGQTNGTIGLQDTNDISPETLESLAFYFQTVGVPAARNLNNKEVIRGSKVFNSVGCDACHTPEFTTGAHPIAALSFQTIFPYTDLLLHAMGEGLADGRPEFEATGREWRTPPLWGIGLTKTVNPNARFLHDGRAATIEEAILWHGGEAEASKNAFVALSQADRQALLKFLDSL